MTFGNEVIHQSGFTGCALDLEDDVVVVTIAAIHTQIFKGKGIAITSHIGDLAELEAIIGVSGGHREAHAPGFALGHFFHGVIRREHDAKLIPSSHLHGAAFLIVAGIKITLAHVTAKQSALGRIGNHHMAEFGATEGAIGGFFDKVLAADFKFVHPLKAENPDFTVAVEAAIVEEVNLHFTRIANSEDP